jgi:hypothetical protein
VFPTLFDPTDGDPVTILGPAAITLGRSYNGLVLYYATVMMMMMMMM